jgi:hypothetical protein
MRKSGKKSASGFRILKTANGTLGYKELREALETPVWFPWVSGEFTHIRPFDTLILTLPKMFPDFCFFS